MSKNLNKSITPTTFHMDAANDAIVEKSLKGLRSHANKIGKAQPKKKDVINFMISKVGVINPEEFFN